MANTSSRTLRLLSLLQTRRQWAGRDLTERLGISERTLRRDVDRLRDLGYPVEAERGLAGGYRLRSGTAMPPLLLDDDEVVAIAVGLRAAASGTVRGLEETSLRALTKVVQVMPRRLRPQADAVRTHTEPVPATEPQADADVVMVLTRAARDHEQLRFSYPSPSSSPSSSPSPSDLRTERLVEPVRVVTLGRRWYLVAWDTERVDWRVFRVDRVRDPVATGVAFRPRQPPGGDAATFARDRIAERPTRYDVVVDVRAPAAEVERVAVFTGGTVTPHGAQACRVSLRVDSLSWVLLLLGEVGAEFEVVRPPELRSELRAVSGLFRRAAERHSAESPGDVDPASD